MVQESALHDMKEICKYCKRSPATILAWIRQLGFPAEKIGGSWESDKNEIIAWRIKLIRAGVKSRMPPGLKAKTRRASSENIRKSK